MNVHFPHRRTPAALAAVFFLCSAFVSTDAQALALGAVRVNSALGQPLRAEIPLSQASAEEIQSLMVRVAPQATFSAHGLEYSPTAAAVQVRVEPRGSGHVIALSTAAPVDDLFVDLVLETDWMAGSLSRSYTLLLDPPPQQRAAPALTAAPQIPAPAPNTAAPTAGVTQPGQLVAEVSPQALAPQTNRPTPQGMQDLNRIQGARGGSGGGAAADASSANASAVAQPRPKSPNDMSGVSQRPTSSTTPSGTSSRAPSSVTVRRGDTLGQIASSRKPRGVSLDQMLVAILQANPDAFVDGNINRLRAGAVLKMPTKEQAQAIAADVAREQVAAQSRDFNAFRRGLASHAPRARVDAADRASGGRISARVSDSRSAAAPADKLTLSKAPPANNANAAAAATSEADLAQQKQVRAQQDRLKELQRNLAELQGINASTSAAPAAATTALTTPAVTTPSAAASSVDAPSAPTPPAPSAAAPTTAAPAAAPALATNADSAAPAPSALATPDTAAAAAPADPAVQPAPQQPEQRPAAPTSEPERPAAERKNPPASAATDDDLIAKLALPVGAAAAAVLVGLLGWLGWQRRKNRADAPILSALAPTASPEPAAAAESSPEPQQQEPAALDPIAQADALLALGQTTQAIDVLQRALPQAEGEAEQAMLLKLAGIHAQQHDLQQLETTARTLLAVSGGQGSAWQSVLTLGHNMDPTNPLYGAAKPAAAAPASSFAEALGQAAPVAEPDPAPAAAEEPATPAMAAEPKPDPFAELELDLDLPAATPEPAPAAPAAPASSADELDLDLNLDDVSAVAPQPSADPAPTAAPEPEDDANTPEDPSLGTKLDLAREFNSFGDTEGARALIEEVLASARRGSELHQRAVQMLTDLPVA